MFSESDAIAGFIEAYCTWIWVLLNGQHQLKQSLIVISIITWNVIKKKALKQIMERHSMSLDTCVRIELSDTALSSLLLKLTDLCFHFCSLSFHFSICCTPHCYFRVYRLFVFTFSLAWLCTFFLLHCSYNSRN